MSDRSGARVKIFVSSTFVDLRDVRARVINWLGGVFEAGLVIMETSGSDAAPPNILSTRRVRECDLFLGLYAHRYGSIDPDSGKSITELELDEAKQSFSSGSLRDILLYVLPEDAGWLSEHRDVSPEAVSGRRRLREKAAEHTYTAVKTEEDLLFAVVRDVRRKLDEHFRRLPQSLRPFALPAPRKIQQPVGMEFVTSEFRDYLLARQGKVEELTARVSDNPTVLLLGESGTGKTSLIHAGLIPMVVRHGWRPVLCRPFGLPCSDIVQQIQSSLFGGARSHRSELAAVVAEAVAALKGKTLLLIIDQFEDVLATRDREDLRLWISTLSTLRQLGDPCLRMLISYRADLEARLGEYWQFMSGAPSGLPRVYVGGLEQVDLWSRIEKTTSDLKIQLKIDEAGSTQIVKDLAAASSATGVHGVYPPHVQMLIDHLWKFSTVGKSAFAMEDYKRAGGVQGIIGTYLSRKLEYAHDVQGHLKSVLVSLVRSYGVKAQKELAEVQADTGLDAAKCEIALEKLIDLRLVRHVETYYEITHDFVARKVINELADSEEKEFKRFRELLSSKAAAYSMTRSMLTAEELLMLYKHRQRIIANDQELHLLLISFIRGTGPTLYWLLNTPPEKISGLLSAEEAGRGFSREEEANVVLLRRKLGATLFPDGDFSSFRHYQRSWELTRLITEDSVSLPVAVLSFGLRHLREEVRDAAFHAIAERVEKGDLNWIMELRRSSSFPSFQAYLRLVFQRNIPIVTESADSRALFEFSLLQRLERTTAAREAQIQWRRITEVHLPNRVRLFGKALFLAKTGRVDKLLKFCDRLAGQEAVLALEALASDISVSDLKILLNKFVKWTRQCGGRFDERSAYAKPLALAEAILRAIRREHLPHLRHLIKSVTLSPPMRPIVLALIIYGSSSDLEVLLDKIASSNEDVKLWNHTELGYWATALMARQPGRMPKFLKEPISREEFWSYLRPEERRKALRGDLLPIKDPNNRGVFVRLVAYGAIGASKRRSKDLLVRLSGHSYGLVARAAATRLADLLQENALNLLAKGIEAHIQQRKVESFADALRFSEMRVFGVI